MHMGWNHSRLNIFRCVCGLLRRDIMYSLVSATRDNYPYRFFKINGFMQPTDVLQLHELFTWMTCSAIINTVIWTSTKHS